MLHVKLQLYRLRLLILAIRSRNFGDAGKPFFTPDTDAIPQDYYKNRLYEMPKSAKTRKLSGTG